MIEGTPMDQNETSPAEIAPGEELMDLDFTKVETTPAEASGAENDKADIAAALAKAQESYDWDTPDQQRAGFN